MDSSSKSEFATMGDAAFVHDLDGTSFDAVGGYLFSPNAFHPWSPADWKLIPGPKLPIYVAPFGSKNGTNDGAAIVKELRQLHVPVGSLCALDMEAQIDKTYVEHVYKVVNGDGYLMWVYGSASSVFEHIDCNGYWVADYVKPPAPFMYPHIRVHATQWEAGTRYDSSTVKHWTLRQFWQ
jgi:hypothetical protein